MKTSLAFRIWLLVSFLLLMLVSCTIGGSTNGVASIAPTQPPLDSGPTSTTLLPPPALVLLAGPEADLNLAAQIEPIVVQLAAEFGLHYELRQVMGPDSAPQNTRYVVALAPASTLADLVIAMPDVQFVAVGFEGLPQMPNLTMIGSGGDQKYVQGFLAGYIAALSSNEYRVGIISVGGEVGSRYRTSFLNGAIYFCGFCNPVYPPYEVYPLYYEVDPAGGIQVLQAAAEDLIARSVDTIHVAPGVGNDELLVYLAGRGLMIIGTSAPPDAILGNWVASVELDFMTSFQEVLRSVLQGSPMGEVSGSIKITYTNPNFLSQGRIAHLEELLEQLGDGTIDPVGE